MKKALLASSMLLCLIGLPAFAQDDSKEAAKLPPVDWVAVESTGVISSGQQGGVEKTIWRDQKRSEIEFLLSRLPDQQPVRAVESLQRRLLLSTVDARLINNDIGPLRGGDMLIQRINKLMEMGLYDDARNLQGQKSEDPYDVSIAQLGILLMISNGDMATACLEEKVLSSKYPKDTFFDTLDRACAHTMGSGKPSFPDNSVLQSTFNDPSYSVSAANPDALVKMGNLERAIVMANGKIRYDGLNREILAKTPPSVVALYVMDKSLPEAASAMVNADLLRRGLNTHLSSAAKDANLKKAYDIKAVPERWSYVESAISDPNRNASDLVSFAGLVAEAEPAQLSTELTTKALAIQLAGGQTLSKFWIDAAQKTAPQKPIVYIYLQAFSSLTPSKIPSLERTQVMKALGNLKPQDRDQVIAILDTLDEKADFGTDVLNAYDKHLVLTQSGNYVMPSLGLDILLDTAPAKKQTGITVLAVLNSLAAKPDNMYSGSVRKALSSMLNVGLIEDARMTGSEMVASVLNKY